MTPDQQRRAQQALDKLNAGDVSGSFVLSQSLLAELPQHRDLIILTARSARLSGQPLAALTLLRAHIDRTAGDMDARYELALVEFSLGLYLPATQKLAQIYALAPNALAIVSPLGDALMNTSYKQSALSIFDHAHRLSPGIAGFPAAAGAAAMDLGWYQKTIEFSSLALAIDRRQIHAWINLGNALLQLGQADESCQALRTALDIEPDNPQVRSNLIDALRGANRFDDAWSLMPIETSFEPLLARRASMLQEIGHAGQALPVWRHLAGQNDPYVSRYLSALSLADHAASLSVLDETRTLILSRPKPNPARIAYHPKSKIKLGYFSGDFRAHSVARNIESVLNAHDRSKFDITLYSNVAKPDWFTQRFARLSDRMISAVDLSDDALADQVRADQIDIFVQLAARFDENRLMLGRHRMTPVQISFHDIATSGMEEMDYLIADRALHPACSTEGFSERVIHLPRFYTHTPIDTLPDVNNLPLLSSDHKGHSVSFGSFNNPTKLSRETLELWRRLLQSIPGSKLYLRYGTTYDAMILRDYILHTLQLDPDRVIFMRSGKLTTADHLALYHHIDISLDTMPFSGSTTTYESLLMGVPVLTMPGISMVSRWTMSMLQAVGLSSFIATDADDFVAKGQKMPADPVKLNNIRSGLRSRVLNSSLSRPERQTRHLERLYRHLLMAYRSRSAD